MRLAIIGRTEMLYQAALSAVADGHEIVLVATAAVVSPESTVGIADFEKLARRHGALFLKASRFSSEHVAVIRATAPECGVTMNWPTMIGPDIVDCFPRGIINAHGSDLPEFRGNACPNWAILAGKDRIGLTFHFIDPFGLDTGDVVHQSFIRNHDELYIGDVYDWLREAVPRGFCQSLMRLQEPGFKAEKQDETRATRAYPRRADDGRLVFERSAEHLHRLIRASSRPFSGAFCFYEGGDAMRVWRATRIAPPVPIFAVPGQIMHFEGDAPVIACGDGNALRFDEYEMESGNILRRSVRSRLT
ncbi:methionyl-tRNA formyltransferase [Bosea thiooxidans]